MEPSSKPPQAPPHDHRVDIALAKRNRMRLRILEATMQVFSRINDDAPVIEDVVREADISRGTFYKYFDSLDEALVAAGTEAAERMIADILPLYDILKEPWQRSSVGFRIHLVRAWRDPKWAAFVTRMEVFRKAEQTAKYVSQDMRRGKELGQFQLDDVQTATDFMIGAEAGCMQALRAGVADPLAYIDAAVRMTMQALGCTPELRERAVAFSRKHLAEWASGERSAWKGM